MVDGIKTLNPKDVQYRRFLLYIMGIQFKKI